MNAPKVAIAGAGIGGLSAAIALRARGIDVEVYEAAARQRSTGTALGLPSNAVKVLRAAGIDLAAGDGGQPLERFDVCTRAGKLIRAMPVGEITAELGAPIVSIHRNALIRTLEEAAGDVPVHYGARIVDFDSSDSGVRVLCADGRSVHADVLIGADGIRSAVRAELDGDCPPTAHRYVCWLATVAFTHPRLVRGYCGHYWGRGQRFGLIDIGGGMSYWWGTKNMPVDQARHWCGGKEEILAAFHGWAPEIAAVIEQTPEDVIVSVPAQDRPFLRQWGKGRISLLGDAAHPMQTGLAQGAGAAIEDGYVLAEALARIPDPVAALRKYEDLRLARTRMLVRRSRRYSKLEQMQNPVGGAVRNLGLRCAPKRALKRMNKRPMQFDLAWESR